MSFMFSQVRKKKKGKPLFWIYDFENYVASDWNNYVNDTGTVFTIEGTVNSKYLELTGGDVGANYENSIYRAFPRMILPPTTNFLMIAWCSRLQGLDYLYDENYPTMFFKFNSGDYPPVMPYYKQNRPEYDFNLDRTDIGTQTVPEQTNLPVGKADIDDTYNSYAFHTSTEMALNKWVWNAIVVGRNGVSNMVMQHIIEVNEDNKAFPSLWNNEVLNHEELTIGENFNWFDLQGMGFRFMRNNIASKLQLSKVLVLVDPVVTKPSHEQA